MSRTVLIAIYDHPSKFPPTLNAITALNKSFDRIVVLYRDTISQNSLLDWSEKCVGIGVKDLKTINSSTFWKLLTFIRFFLKLWYCNLKFRPKFNLVYDSYALSSFKIIKYFIPKTKLWYHNHDVTDLAYVKKYSLTYWCYKIEQKSIDTVDMLSLPDLSRAKFFAGRSAIEFLPNYPNLDFNTAYHKSGKIHSDLKVLYQGRVSSGHGILEFMQYLKHAPYKLTFHIIGSYDTEFKKTILNYIYTHKLTQIVTLYEALPYYKLKQFSQNFDIGFAVLEPVNIQYRTGANASNKIYEYVALGMPVILFDSEHYKQTLQKYKWAKFTDLSARSFDHIMEDFNANYDDCSKSAYLDYRRHLNFEAYFSDVLKKIIS